ncbi:cell division protein ZipA [Aliiglaciecola litoralis]|uniref:Cell division protein ZipA n=1 Tax=Aliiglaciecola litoralis TaxID=582857 RepID=A0ABN1LCM3_9ALTE
MEELRLAFLVIGAIAIVGILLHGMWSVRKNSKESRHANLETADWQDDFDDAEDVDLDDDVLIIDPQSKDNKVEPRVSAGENFDDLGLGAVRVVASAPNANDDSAGDSDLEAKSQEVQASSETDLSKDAEALLKEDQAIPAPVSKPKIYSSVVTQPKPEYAAQQVHAMRSRTATQADGELHNIPEPPPFLLKTGDDQKSETVGAATSSANPQQPNAPHKQADASSSMGAIGDTHASQTLTNTDSKNTVESDTLRATSIAEPEMAEESSKVSLAEQARNFVKRKAEAKPKSRKRREPKIGEDQMRIDFDEPSESRPTNENTAADVNKASTQAAEQAAPAQEVLVLNVRASDDNPIQGAALLPMLLTLGFKFGDQDIFHRHVNSNGKGPVLFSLANMLKPGVFDIDNLENFSTLGVSLFMMLPIEGDPHQVFNMMHNAARKIAEEFSAQVLDGRRSALTKQSLQQYVEKIREFERKRMIAR